MTIINYKVKIDSLCGPHEPDSAIEWLSEWWPSSPRPHLQPWRYRRRRRLLRRVADRRLSQAPPQGQSPMQYLTTTPPLQTFSDRWSSRPRSGGERQRPCGRLRCLQRGDRGGGRGCRRQGWWEGVEAEEGKEAQCHRRRAAARIDAATLLAICSRLRF